jgi:beta-glucanase (GH16 family)
MRLLLLLAVLISAAHSRDSLLVWQDEFDVPGQPDPSRWGWDEGGSGGGNGEAQYYTRNRPANARVEDGQLVITARREDTLTCWYGPCKFTSARLVTRGLASWLYGRVDVRAKLPKGKGVWPAIWMLAESSPYGGWPGSGEIDIMEHVGYEPGTIYGTVHTQAYNHKIGTSSGSSTTVVDPT